MNRESDIQWFSMDPFLTKLLYVICDYRLSPTLMWTFYCKSYINDSICKVNWIQYLHLKFYFPKLLMRTGSTRDQIYVTSTFRTLPFTQSEWVSDCCLSPNNFSAISWQEQVNFQWDDGEVCFVLDQHA